MARCERACRPQDLEHIDEAVREADYVLVAWGHDFVGPRHAQALLDRITTLGGKKVHCLGIGKKGSPKHPGRLAADTPAIRWKAAKLGKTFEKF